MEVARSLKEHEGSGPPIEPKHLASLTPMMRQYSETKALHPDAFLFFRLGDFYEMFFEDAVRASEILQIALTARSKGPEAVPMCGVPYHSARRYIAKLIDAGHRVAICEQVEPAGSGPGLVRREIVRVISPGMVLDDEVLESRAHNFLAAVTAIGDRYGCALLEASTGEFWAFESESAAEVGEELSRWHPREVLAADGRTAQQSVAALCRSLPHHPVLTTADEGSFSPTRASAYLKTHFAVHSLDGFGLSGSPLAIGAAGAALRHLKETQKSEAAHVDRLSRLVPDQYLLLDDATQCNLEIVRTLREDSRRGALIAALDRTSTSMGARKLARWLLAPLRSVKEINLRLDAVEELLRHAVWREELGGVLREVADLERLGGRLSMGVGNARDLKSLGHSLTLLPQLAAVLGRCQSPLLRVLKGPLESPVDLGQLLQSAVAEDPPIGLREGGMIRRGYSEELDNFVALSTSGKDFLLQLEARERSRTGISSLKVRFNRVFGYYIEVTKTNLHLVPEDYQRRQTTVGAERYITPELKEYEEKVLNAEEKRAALEFQIFEDLRMRVVGRASQIRAAGEAVATIDVLLSFARTAADQGYQRPSLDDSESLEIVAGRHPVVERSLPPGELFIPNDVKLDSLTEQVLIVTGPNMAGKSTVMRQVALIVLMAQAGSFVPAKRARIGICDRIFTRVGAADDLARGQSTFMVEMTETANILHHATAKSLVVLDEIGRGTATFDGLSIAWAVAEFIHDRIGARTLFATHYHELTDLPREKSRVANASIAVKETDGKIIFLRKLVSGAANRSYGIEVARLAGLPNEVVRRAREILRNLESGELDEAGRPALIHQREVPVPQLPLFPTPPSPAEAKILKDLQAVSVDTLSPLEALNLLAAWKKKVAPQRGA